MGFPSSNRNTRLLNNGTMSTVDYNEILCHEALYTTRGALV